MSITFCVSCLILVADVKAVVNDDVLYEEAASEAFPLYNKSHMISLEMPGGIGDVCFLGTLYFCE